MKLYKVYDVLFEKYRNRAMSNLDDEAQYYVNLGRMKMLNELFAILSHESLFADIELREDVLLKGD